MTYETVRCWKFGKAFAFRVKTAPREPSGTRHIDEVFVALCGEKYLLWRAADEYGVDLHYRASTSHTTCAAILGQKQSPRSLRMKYASVKASAGINDRAENSHRLTGERRMRGLGDLKTHTKKSFLLGLIRKNFVPKRHLLLAPHYREPLAIRLTIRGEFAEFLQNPPFVFWLVIAPSVLWVNKALFTLGASLTKRVDGRYFSGEIVTHFLRTTLSKGYQTMYSNELAASIRTISSTDAALASSL